MCFLNKLSNRGDGILKMLAVYRVKLNRTFLDFYVESKFVDLSMAMILYSINRISSLTHFISKDPLWLLTGVTWGVTLISNALYNH
jgi:hypothetical protein